MPTTITTRIYAFIRPAGTFSPSKKDEKKGDPTGPPLYFEIDGGLIRRLLVFVIHASRG